MLDPSLAMEASVYWLRESVGSAYVSVTTSVATPRTIGPRLPPGATAGRVLHVSGNVIELPSGDGRLIGAALTPEGMGIPPVGRPCPVWMKSRTITLSAACID